MIGQQRGRLIAIEGIDGCGKSTQAAQLAAHLGALLTHEPGATATGQAIRSLVLDPDGTTLSPQAETLLLLADRAEHVALVITPALDSGKWVVSDRYSGSTVAYQGHGRSLDSEAFRALVGWAECGLPADLNVLIDVSPDLAMSRLGSRRRDRLEQLGTTFSTTVRDGFLAQAHADTEHWVVVAGDGSADQVAADLRRVVLERLGSPPASDQGLPES